jgi:hypothetical protein
MTLVLDHEHIPDPAVGPRPRLQIIEHATAEGFTPPVLNPLGLFSDLEPARASAVTEVEVPETKLEQTPIPVTDLEAELLALGVAENIPAPPKRTRRLSKKFSLIDPNQAWVMWVAVLFLGGILAASLASSFTSVYAMAAWVGAPPAVQWLPVVILDVAIVGFSWALMVFASRLADPDETADDKNIVREKTGRTRFYLTFVTSFSVVANFMHTFTFWKEDLSSPQAITGVVFSASIPLMALVATEELIRLVFIRRRKIQADSE